MPAHAHLGHTHTPVSHVPLVSGCTNGNTYARTGPVNIRVHLRETQVSVKCATTAGLPASGSVLTEALAEICPDQGTGQACDQASQGAGCCLLGRAL